MSKVTETVQSVEKAVDLINCFSINQPELTIADFVRKTGINRTTVFRLLTSLIKKGLLIKDEATSTYRLSLTFVCLSQIVTENLDIRKIAFPVLKRLSDLTNETISLNILQANKRVCIDKIDGNEDIRHILKIGYPYPLLRGASGKVLLAFSSSQLLKNIITEWEALNNQVINKEELDFELNEIKHKGYAFSINDRVIGAYSISTPIFNSNNEIIAGLSVSGFEARLTQNKKTEIIKLAIQGAKEISKKMGAFQFEKGSEI